MPIFANNVTGDPRPLPAKLLTLAAGFNVKVYFGETFAGSPPVRFAYDERAGQYLAIINTRYHPEVYMEEFVQELRESLALKAPIRFVSKTDRVILEREITFDVGAVFIRMPVLTYRRN